MRVLATTESQIRRLGSHVHNMNLTRHLVFTMAGTSATQGKNVSGVSCYTNNTKLCESIVACWMWQVQCGTKYTFTLSIYCFCMNGLETIAIMAALV